MPKEFKINNHIINNIRHWAGSYQEIQPLIIFYLQQFLSEARIKSNLIIASELNHRNNQNFMNLEGIFRGKTIQPNWVSPHVNPAEKIQYLPLWLALFQPYISKQARGIERQQKYRKKTQTQMKKQRDFQDLEM